MFLDAPDAHVIFFVVLGLAFLGGAVLPRLLEGRPVSSPMVFLLFGFLVFLLPLPLPTVDPIESGRLFEYLTEVGVIVSLMGAGLKIDRPFSWRRWGTTWRLLALTMPLTIFATMLLGVWALALSPATALLLGAVLAPTDPVLASDVQVGPPGGGPDEEDDVRFALTSEAGLNDALAFPFVHAAVSVVVLGTNLSSWVLDWVRLAVVFKLLAGLLAGVLVGLLLSVVVFRLPERLRLAQSGEGFVSLAGTFLAYGLTEAVGGYGFLAVFVAALTLRRSERSSSYHETLHDFAEQSERLLMIVVVLLLGAAVAGGVLAPLTWEMVLVASALVFVVRPAAGLAALLRSPLPWRERAAVSFFGIRGIGSLYYLSYALNEAEFEGAAELWALVAFTVVLSILVHGVSASFVTERLDACREPEPGLDA